MQLVLWPQHARRRAPKSELGSVLKVERLEQSYTRIPDAQGRLVFDYESPRFSYRADLLFARDGLVAVYPRIGERKRD